MDSSAEALAHHGKGGDAGEVGEFLSHLVHDLPRGSALRPVGEDKHDDAGVEIALRANGAWRSDEEAHGFAGFGIRHESALDFVHVIDEVIVRRALGAVDEDEECAAVLTRGVFAGNLLEEPPAGTAEREEYGGGGEAVGEDGFEKAQVEGLGGGEHAVHRSGEAGGGLALAQDFRGHHRRECERHEAGNGDRRRQRECEFRKEAADVAAEEADGNENGDENKRGGDNGEPDLTRSAVGGDEWRFAEFFHAANDVFQNNDRVVHEDADS